MSGVLLSLTTCYVDDLTVTSPSITAMEEVLCVCDVYSLEHAIVYNPKRYITSFIVNYDVIPESEKIKYLGHII